MAVPCLGAYAATKHALTGMTEALRHEVRDFGVHVTAVEPGPYKTDIFGRNANMGSLAERPDSPYATLSAQVRRLGKKAEESAGDPQEVADRIVSLLANDAPQVIQHWGQCVLLNLHRTSDVACIEQRCVAAVCDNLPGLLREAARNLTHRHL